MRRCIGLITCTREKTRAGGRARDLYSASETFCRCLAFAEQHYDVSYVVSARYGLVDLDQILPYYDRYLGDFSETERDAWATFIVANLRQDGMTSEDTVFIHADEMYRTHLTRALREAALPYRDFDFWSLPDTIE